MNFRTVDLQCKVCHKPMKVQLAHQPGEECPIESLDIFAKWLTCEECLIRMKRAVREPVRQPTLPLPEAPEPRQSEPRQVKQVGLPYKDE